MAAEATAVVEWVVEDTLAAEAAALIPRVSAAVTSLAGAAVACQGESVTRVEAEAGHADRAAR